MRQINLSNTGVVATIMDDGKTIKLTDSVNGPMEINNLSVYGIGTAQKDSYIAKGFAVEGYDVVAYFSNKAVKGDKKIVAKHNGVLT